MVVEAGLYRAVPSVLGLNPAHADRSPGRHSPHLWFRVVLERPVQVQSSLKRSHTMQVLTCSPHVVFDGSCSDRWEVSGMHHVTVSWSNPFHSFIRGPSRDNATKSYLSV